MGWGQAPECEGKTEDNSAQPNEILEQELHCHVFGFNFKAAEMAQWVKDLSPSISWIPESHMAAEGENIPGGCSLIPQYE